MVLGLLGSIYKVQAAYAEPESVINSPFLRHAEEGKGQNITAQVTSVSQLSDVQPTDWAFTSLQSLVERYGCIAGYPNATFRGNRVLSRYEFAAGLNACLDKINQIISTGLADKVGKEDLATLQKLQAEFATELTALKGRVDSLESKTETLEAQQFSTTTKLTGQVVLAFSGGGSGNANILLPNGTLSGNSGTANTTAIARVRLELNSTFTGEDLLVTRLETGNGGSGLGSFLDGIFANSDVDYAGSGSTVTLGILRYDFSPIQDIRVAIGPQIDLSDKLDLNSFANDEAHDFSSGLFINNPLILPLNTGAGGVIEWNPSGGAFNIKVGYVAGNGASPVAGITENPIGNNLFAASSALTNGGIGGDPYQLTAELEFAPKDSGFAARLQYTRAAIGNLDFNIGGVNLEWLINPTVAIFGRFGFGGISDRISTINPYTWSAGVAFPNLFREKALAAIAVGQPFIERTVGNSTQTNIEAFYKFPLSENISITPDLQFIINGNNNSNNGLITIGTLRTVFSF
ncbi:carbohydrate-selective porin [Synechococcus sp. PCC 7502]|nr:carbohydrate-selective porin [Synechococcus sp. PCC 7502]